MPDSDRPPSARVVESDDNERLERDHEETERPSRVVNGSTRARAAAHIKAGVHTLLFDR